MKVPYTLIVKFLAGEITKNENALLLSWRNASKKNNSLFEELKDAWLLSQQPGNIVVPDKETVWNKIMSGIKETPVIRMYTRRALIRVASIAAGIALLLGLSFAYFHSPNDTLPGRYVTFRTPPGQKGEIILPDGTSVWLNAGSVLTYSTLYSEKNRNVQLQGQAFFDVVKNDRLPFSVAAGDVNVVVHGTAFDVNAYPEDKTMSVSLLRGHVSVRDASDKLLADMQPGQKVFVDKSTMENTLIACDAELESIWRYGHLKIEDQELLQVIEKMERWYGVNIQLLDKNKTHKEHYWLTIKTESLTEMLELINKITPINYTIKGEEVTIQYKR